MDDNNSSSIVDDFFMDPVFLGADTAGGLSSEIAAAGPSSSSSTYEFIMHGIGEDCDNVDHHHNNNNGCDDGSIDMIGLNDLLSGGASSTDTASSQHQQQYSHDDNNISDMQSSSSVFLDFLGSPSSSDQCISEVVADSASEASTPSPFHILSNDYEHSQSSTQSHPQEDQPMFFHGSPQYNNNMIPNGAAAAAAAAAAAYSAFLTAQQQQGQQYNSYHHVNNSNHVDMHQFAALMATAVASAHTQHAPSSPPQQQSPSRVIRKRNNNSTSTSKKIKVSSPMSSTASFDTDEGDNSNDASSSVNGKKRSRSDEERESAKADRQRQLDDLIEERKRRKLTKEEQSRLKSLRNQLTAQESRDRRKQTIDSLSQENKELREENDLLRVRVKELEDELEQFRKPSSPAARSATMLFACLFCIGFLCLGYQQILSPSSNSDDASPWANVQGGSTFQIAPASMSHQRSVKSSSINDSDIIPYRSQSHQQSLAKSMDQHQYNNVYSVPSRSSGSASENDELAALDQLIMKDVDDPLCEEYLRDMTQSAVLVPTGLKRHFRFENCHKQQHPSRTVQSASSLSDSTALEIDTGLNLIPYGDDKHKVDAMYEDGNFEMAHMYHFEMSEDKDSDKTTIRMICPFSYPLLDSPGGRLQTPNKRIDFKFYIPDHRHRAVTDSTGRKLFRVAEITAESVHFGDAFFAIDSTTGETVHVDSPPVL